MNTQELRLGNYLQDSVTKTTLEVIVLSKDMGIYTWVIDRSKYPLPDGWQLEPIPLTEEWLLKFGFKKVKSDYEEAETWDFYFGILYFDMANNSVKINGQYCLYNIPEHVHQLQNLYFALTGEELTLKQ